MRMLTRGVREEIISFQDEEIPTDDTVKPPTSSEFIDTHGHLDMHAAPHQNKAGYSNRS